MAIARGLAVTGDVQTINAHRDYLENDLEDGRPNVADIEGYIDFRIDDINMQLSTAGYTLPIVEADSPLGYRYVKYWNALGAAEMCETLHGDADIAESLKDQYDDMVKNILEQIVILVDVPGAPLQENLAESGTSNLTEAGDVKDPFFTRADEF